MRVYKQITLKPRKRYYGWDYRRGQKLGMTGAEWHRYARLAAFKRAPDPDNGAATGAHLEIWLDGKDHPVDRPAVV